MRPRWRLNVKNFEIRKFKMVDEVASKDVYANRLLAYRLDRSGRSLVWIHVGSLSICNCVQALDTDIQFRCWQPVSSRLQRAGMIGSTLLKCVFVSSPATRRDGWTTTATVQLTRSTLSLSRQTSLDWHSLTPLGMSCVPRINVVSVIIPSFLLSGRRVCATAIVAVFGLIAWIPCT